MNEKRAIEFGLFLGVLCGTFATVGGWWMVLSIMDVVSPMPSGFSWLNFIITFCTVITFLTALIIGGPYLIWDSVKGYREKRSKRIEPSNLTDVDK